MSMKYKPTTQNNNNKQIIDLLIPNTEKEKLELEARMIQLDFIDRLHELMKYKNIKSKKELADLLGTTPSFITQLFSAEKLINLKHLAKLQRVLGIKYAIISDQYLRLKNSFRDDLVLKGYREMRIDIKEIKPGLKKSA